MAQEAAPDAFRARVASIVARDPRIAEARAGYREARAGVGEARQLLMPAGDASLTRTRTLARGFSNDRNAIIERSRPVLRTDALVQVEQTVADFGTGAGRLQAARARAAAALAGIADNATQVAFGAVQAIADVVAYRRLVALCDVQIAREWRLREELVQRLVAGVSAPADLAQIDGTIAETAARHAGYARALAGAEARHLALAGTRLPDGITVTPPRATLAAGGLPGVAAADAGARAARADATSARGQALPRLVVGVSAGRYGVFETDRDYDVRGNVTLRVPLLGGLGPRAEAARARADAAAARADRVRIEAERDAGIAGSDVIALEREVAALDANLAATARARDVIAERFVMQRGSLLDRLAAEERVAQVEARVVEARNELLLARYVRLARSGALLAELGLDATMGTNR